jgi:hypothetical protein
MHDEGFSRNLALKYFTSSQICVRSTEMDSTKPDCSEQNHAQPNQGLHGHIKM